MKRVTLKNRDPAKEYPDQTPIATPVSFNGKPAYKDEVKHFLTEWSRTQAEQQHVETIEEANDFFLPEEDNDDEDFFSLTPTVYEMHEIQAEADELVQEAPPSETPESNETVDPGAPSTPPDPAHDQSAPVE